MNLSILDTVSNDRIAELPPLDLGLAWRGISADDCLSYSLTLTGEVLHVERVRIRPGGARTAQCALFADSAQFRKWCECDDMRYQYVHLCTVVLSKGLGLFEKRVPCGGIQTQLRFG